MQDTTAQLIAEMSQQMGKVVSTVEAIRAQQEKQDERLSKLEEQITELDRDRFSARLFEWLGTSTGAKVGACIVAVATAVSGYIVGLVS